MTVNLARPSPAPPRLNTAVFADDGDEQVATALSVAGIGGKSSINLRDADVSGLRTVHDQGSYASEKSVWRSPLLVDSVQFNMLFGSVILVNAICIAIETDLNDQEDSSTRKLLDILEIVFLAIFFIELVIRFFSAESLIYFLKEPWNIADLSLVVIGVFDMISTSLSLRQITMFRLFRLLKLYRLLRVIRFFKQLWLLVIGLFHAMRILSWVFLLITLLLYLFAVLLTQQYRSNVSGLSDAEGLDPHELEWRFGSVLNTMWTLFELLTLENWTTWGDPITRSSPGWAFFFVFFLIVMHYGILNLVVAIVVEETMASAQQIDNKKKKKQEEERQAIIQKMKQIFVVLDTSGDRCLSKHEFVEAFEFEEIVEAFKALNVPPDDIMWLFEVLDENRDEGVDIDEFIDGCLKLHGVAKAKDIFELYNRVMGLQRTMRRLCSETFPGFRRGILGALHSATPDRSHGSNSSHSTAVSPGFMSKLNSHAGHGSTQASGKGDSHSGEHVSDQSKSSMSNHAADDANHTAPMKEHPLLAHDATPVLALPAFSTAEREFEQEPRRLLAHLERNMRLRCDQVERKIDFLLQCFPYKSNGVGPTLAPAPLWPLDPATQSAEVIVSQHAMHGGSACCSAFR